MFLLSRLKQPEQGIVTQCRCELFLIVVPISKGFGWFLSVSVETQAILDGTKLEVPLPKSRAWKDFLPRYFIDDNDISSARAPSVGWLDDKGGIPDDTATVQKLVDECIKGTEELDIDATAEERQEVCLCITWL